jgi:hypothetical protein
MLGESVRRKILKRLDSNIMNNEQKDTVAPHDLLQHDLDLEEELKRLFRSIDTDGSMLLSRTELKDFLAELDISFSNKRWRQIFKEMDRNYDDQISFDELFLFIFPGHNIALSTEMKRVKIIGERVKRLSVLTSGSIISDVPRSPSGRQLRENNFHGMSVNKEVEASMRESRENSLSISGSKMKESSISISMKNSKENNNMPLVKSCVKSSISYSEESVGVKEAPLEGEVFDFNNESNFD